MSMAVGHSHWSGPFPSKGLGQPGPPPAPAPLSPTAPQLMGLLAPGCAVGAALTITARVHSRHSLRNPPSLPPLPQPSLPGTGFQPRRCLLRLTKPSGPERCSPADPVPGFEAGSRGVGARFTLNEVSLLSGRSGRAKASPGVRLPRCSHVGTWGAGPSGEPRLSHVSCLQAQSPCL